MRPIPKAKGQREAPALSPAPNNRNSVRVADAARHETVAERTAHDVIVEPAVAHGGRAAAKPVGRREALERDVEIFEARGPGRRDGVVDAHADSPTDNGVIGAIG